MSFILDALKKSENERQQQSDAEFATVPSGNDTPSMPRWLWALGALLVVNAVVVTGLLLRPDTPAVGAQPIQSEAQPVPSVSLSAPVEAETVPAPTPSFAERIDAARQDQAARPVPRPEPVAAAPAPAAESTNVAPALPDDPMLLPNIQEVVANGTLSLPPMHIDIHVYSDTPGDRFVFINMNKYREGDRLDEGPVVQEITREGVALSHLGTDFFLSRD